MYLALLVVLTGSWASANSPEFRFCMSKLSFQTSASGTKGLWQHNKVNSILVCVAACMDDPNCRMFSFSPFTKICNGYATTQYNGYATTQYEHDMGNTREDEIILARITCAGSIGSKCEQTNECSFQKSVCFTGVCLCEPGLYYNRNLNTCQRDCSEYGEEMDAYEALGIFGHNNKSFISRTLIFCKQICIKETSFCCLTFEYSYHTGYCHLSASGYLDVKVVERQTDGTGWALVQRRCK